MALARLRRSSRIIALLLLASFWGLSHRGGDDVCVADALQTHDASKHVIGAPDSGKPQHCAVCHSLRAPRRPLGPVPQLHPPLVLSAPVDVSQAVSLRAPALDNLPARAPPATLT
jgi:mono/diheme cytochrome c family protein